MHTYVHIDKGHYTYYQYIKYIHLSVFYSYTLVASYITEIQSTCVSPDLRPCVTVAVVEKTKQQRKQEKRTAKRKWRQKLLLLIKWLQKFLVNSCRVCEVQNTYSRARRY